MRLVQTTSHNSQSTWPKCAAPYWKFCTHASTTLICGYQRPDTLLSLTSQKSPLIRNITGTTTSIRDCPGTSPSAICFARKMAWQPSPVQAFSTRNRSMTNTSDLHSARTWRALGRLAVGWSKLRRKPYTQQRRLNTLNDTNLCYIFFCSASLLLSQSLYKLLI